MSEPVLDLARALIARRSLTPDDAGCQDLLAERLAAAGFAVERMRFGSVDNLWARHGAEPPVLCFAGHTDVVPGGPPDQWFSPPFAPSVRDGYLYGRGAADMKSALSAMTCAAADFVRRAPRHRGSIALLVTSDEEGPAVDGTTRVVDALTARGERIDWCVVGEATSRERLGDEVRVGRRGSYSGKLVVRGVQGHVAYPDKARNAIHVAAPALAELARTHWDDGDEAFPPTSFQISNLRSGTGAMNVIPGLLEATFNFRFAPVTGIDTLRARVESILARHGIEHALQFRLSAAPYLSTAGPLRAAVFDAVAQATGAAPLPSTAGGTSDGRFLAAAGAEVVELGPVNATIHQVNERVRTDDLAPLAAIYLGIAERLLGAG
jgi:succinyl-diaminopimelate desuccinylase